MAKPVTIVPKLYPVIYSGPKEVKTQIIPGRTNGPLPFNREPDGTLIAYATESEAQWIAKNCVGGEFTFPEGTRDTTDVAALFQKIDALADSVALLRAEVDALKDGDEQPKRRGRKPADATELATA